MENIYDVIAWGRVVVQGREFMLLSPRPYHSDMAEDKVGRSIWQIEGTLKWEVAGFYGVEYTDNGETESPVSVYQRSLIIFGSDALLEFYQDPKTIKVKYIVPDDAMA
jgi:hypothetical protein